jgi:hypothetical protein
MHPALFQVLRFRIGALLRRRWCALRTGRNPVGLVIVAVLFVAWLGGIAAATALRETFSLEHVRGSIANGLLVYTLWVCAKTAVKRPEQDLGWSTAERGVLLAGPFTRRQLLVYHLAGMSTTAVFKTLCVCLVLFRDLPNWPLGFLALLLGMTFLELLRMAVEMISFGASRRLYAAFRFAVLLVFYWLAATGTAFIAGDLARLAANGAANVDAVFASSLHAAERLCETVPARAAAAPFDVFARLATAPSIFAADSVLALAIAMGLVATAVWGVFLIDRYFESARRRRELTEFSGIASAAPSPSVRTPAPRASFPRIRRRGGVGPLFWRQWTSARRRWGQVLVLCILPAGLSLTPLLSPVEGAAALAQVAGMLCFYTFLLFSASIKFDFRRDFERLVLLKTLPSRPAAVVLGQLATPVLLASGMQLAVLGVAAALRPGGAPASQVLIVMPFLVVWNVLIFASENLIFLLSPHRENQNGVEMFLRTILVFTAKVLVLSAGLFALIVWTRAAGMACGLLNESGVAMSQRAAYGAGLWLGLVLAAGVAVHLLQRTFARLDVADFNELQ